MFQGYTDLASSLRLIAHIFVPPRGALLPLAR
jgi:hypothetical protein